MKQQKQRTNSGALSLTKLAIVLLGASPSPAVAQSQSDTALDTLKGKNGESACTLKENIYKGCNIDPSTNSPDRPASCTCNLEFFNIMSACAYTSFSSSSAPTLPIYSDWITTCSNSGINMDQAQLLSNSDTWGVESPDWARLGVPGNKTIDLQRAVLLVESGPKPPAKWSTIQIILPILTALIAGFLTFLVASLVRRTSSSPRSLGPSHPSRHSSPGFIERIQRIFKGKPVPRVSVKPMDRYDNEAWEIDDHGGKDYGYGYGTGKRGMGDRETYQFSDIPHSAGVGAPGVIGGAGVGAGMRGVQPDRDRDRERETIFTTPTSPYTDAEAGPPTSAVLTSPPSVSTQARSIPPNGPGAYPFGPTSAPQTFAQRGQPQVMFQPERGKGGVNTSTSVSGNTPGHSRDQSGSSFVGSLRNAIPTLPGLPGISKKKPQKIVEVPPTRGFDINDIDHSSAGANRSTFGFSSAHGEDGEERVFSPTADLKSMDFHDSLERSRSFGTGIMSMGGGRVTRPMSEDQESMGNPNSDIRVVSASTDSYYLHGSGNVGRGVGEVYEEDSIPSIPPLPTHQPPQPLSAQSSNSNSYSSSNPLRSNSFNSSNSQTQQPFRSNSSDTTNPGRPKGVRPLPPSPQLNRQLSTASSMRSTGASDIYADPFSDR